VNPKLNAFNVSLCIPCQGENAYATKMKEFCFQVVYAQENVLNKNKFYMDNLVSPAQLFFQAVQYVLLDSQITHIHINVLNAQVVGFGTKVNV
jgi:predicted methyltransferase